MDALTPAPFDSLEGADRPCRPLSLTPGRFAPHLAYLALLTVGTAALLPLTGYPISWDEVWYMGVAYHSEADAQLLNRYGHIYLLWFFMRFVEDPYLAARLLWCATFMGVVAAMVASTAGLAALTRVFVLATAAALLIAQDQLIQTVGIAYADHTLMLGITLSTALALPPILRGEPFSTSRAMLLGSLFAFTLRSKDLGIVLAGLAAVLWMQPETGIRPTVRGARNLAAYLLGMLLVVAIFAGLDGLILGDPAFSLRPSSWQTLWMYNTKVLGTPSPLNWLTWLLSPHQYTLPVLYILTLLPLAATQKNPRLMLIQLMPLGFILLLVASNYWAGCQAVIPRYMIGILPTLCLLSALAAGLLLEQSAVTPHGRRWMLACGLATVAATLALLTQQDSLPLIKHPDPRFLNEVALPGVFFMVLAMLALAFGVAHWLRAVLSWAAFTIVLVSSLPASFINVDSLVTRQVQAWGEIRYRDFRELTSTIPVAAQSRFLVHPDIYNRELTDRGPYAIKLLLAMNARQPLPDKQQVFIPHDLKQVTAEQICSFDYYIVPPSLVEEVRSKIVAADPQASLVLNQTTHADAKVALIRNLQPRPTRE